MLRVSCSLCAFCLVVGLSGCSDDAKEPATAGEAPAATSPVSDQTTGSEESSGDAAKVADHGNAKADHDGKMVAKNHKSRGGRSHGHPRVGRTSGLAIGAPVPDFEVSIGGKSTRLSALRADRQLTKDGTLVLNFWCSFCHSCRDVEMDLNALAQKYKGEVGVVAIDASVGETAKEVAAFAESKGLTFPIALNPDASVADMLGVRVTTTTVVIDSDGVLRYCGQFADGEHSYAEDALVAVLNHKDVVVSETRLRG